MRRWVGRATALCASLTALPALAQTPPTQVLPGITVTATQLDEARGSIQPSLGASRFDFTPNVVDTIPQGAQAPIGQVLLRAPGVAQDSFGQLHVRGDHGNLQYRLDGVQLPEGLSLFSNALATQYARKMSLITGALPAQYGFRTAGVLDIALKSGTTDPGAEASMTLGTRDWRQPSLTYGGRSGAIDYFATGEFLHNAIGIENPTPSDWPIHDDTDQWHGLAKVTGIIDEQTRVSFIAGGSNARFQIPNNPNQTPGFTVAGASNFDSALLDQRQWESTYFGMVSLQKHTSALDFQLSGFTRYSNLTYQPDPFGDLMFNGIAPWARRENFAIGMQGDGSWKIAPGHTVRGGFLVQREHALQRTDSQVLPVDATGTPTSFQPIGIVQGGDNIGWLYGVYLQDEWKPWDTVTVNYGLRFDVVDGITRENQLSPRLNVVWQPDDTWTLHAGYARYFTPPPLAQVNDGAIAATLGTTAAPALTTNDPVRAERAHYFDAGVEWQPNDKLKFGLDAYYKTATNLLDEGQFGAPVILTSFNYAYGEVKGIELTGSWDDGPWSLFGNVAWSEAKGTQINSAQFNFQAAELAFIQNNWIYLDHNQSWTGSAGAAYTFNRTSDWATRLSADFIYGNGLRKTVVTPNDQANPPYAVLNFSAVQKLPIKGTRGATLRLDVLNALDSSYQLRDGSGVGVGAPQFGLRRTVLVSLTQKF